MKRLLPGLILLLVLTWLGSAWRIPETPPGEFNFKKFGDIPVLEAGRTKPLDTVARNTLMIIRGRQTLRLDHGQTLSAIDWLARVAFDPAQANRYATFAISNPEVLGLFGWEQRDQSCFSYNELEPFLKKIDEQGQLAEAVPPAQRSPFQTAVVNLRNTLMVYQQLMHSLRPREMQNFTAEIGAYEKLIPRAMADPLQKVKLGICEKFVQNYRDFAAASSIQPVPPMDAADRQRGDWLSMGESLAGALADGRISPVTKAYAAIGDAYRANRPGIFNQEVARLSSLIAVDEPAAVNRASFEFRLNQIAPFYQSMGLYVLGFLLVCGSWLGGSQSLNRSAVYVMLVGLALHTFGLAARMVLQGRPPVTNLYSSAVFIGWGTVAFGLILERLHRDGIAMACSAMIGFVTLIIAHHLAGTGETLEMLSAVLDTNLWLATHVVTITIGYSAMFLAGMLANFYVIRGVLTRSFTPKSAQSLASMTYGVICFAALFSFVGTVLGGIWADQSWGRFWGWDPKENGALLIVLWCAIILHARRGGYIRQRGFMMLALFGNVVTSFSWFGVNMLGVGLHSYSFMDKAFPWLILFAASQLALIALAAIPLKHWRSCPTE
jgi:ABC-type transport system involved in cytochrome c biogenesis permease subunit